MTITMSPSQCHFNEFFEMGLAESASPFLRPDARHWAVALPLRAAIIAAFLLLVSFALSWWPALLPLSHLLLVFVYFFAGTPALIESLDDLLSLEVNIDVLMTLAAFSSVLIGNGMEGALLLVLFAISGAMEEAVTAKAKGAISSLHKLTPTRACVVEADGTLIERALQDIGVGTVILVKAGQIVPLDGIVIEGRSSVDVVHLTGESVPVTKGIGDEVAAGSRTIEGSLTIEVSRTSGDSTLARIIGLVTQAEEAKPRLQQWFDRSSRSYALSIIGFSALTACILPFLEGLPLLGTGGALYRALAFLVAASPCALIIAIPIAYLSAISSCASQGILLKGGIALEALARCSTIAFDKTGTLTTGELSFLGITSLEPTAMVTAEEALAVACSMERGAVHPIAQALVNYAEEQMLPSVAIADFTLIPGSGISAQVVLRNRHCRAFLGNLSSLLTELPPQRITPLLERAAAIQAAGELLAILQLEDDLFFLRFTDTLREESFSALEELKRRHLQLLMLTGDHRANAARIASAVGIDHYYADLKPDDKLHHVTEWAERSGLAMIGDGVNDAPALARATVGICMGKVGSATAAEAADIILLHDNISHLGWLIDKAVQTRSVVRQNLTLAIIAILFASLPALAGMVPLWLAVIMHEGGTVLVGLNALRLLRH